MLEYNHYSILKCKPYNIVYYNVTPYSHIAYKQLYTVTPWTRWQPPSPNLQLFDPRPAQEPGRQETENYATTEFYMLCYTVQSYTMYIVCCMLCYTVSFCAVLQYLCCGVLCYNIYDCLMLYYFVLYSTVLYCIVLYMCFSIVFCSVAKYCVKLCYTMLY